MTAESKINLIKTIAQEAPDKITTAKACWEKTALPAILYGLEIIYPTKAWIKKGKYSKQNGKMDA